MLRLQIEILLKVSGVQILPLDVEYSRSHDVFCVFDA